jgi:hypothetical protein
LTWNSTQTITVFARHITSDGGFSGAEPVRNIADGSNTLSVAYVEDTGDFRSDLQLNNNGSSTANVTVTFIDVADPSGVIAGTRSSRDIPVEVNSATMIQDVIRWALGTGGPDPLGKRGFLLISSPQAITVQVSMQDTTSGDPAISDEVVAASNSFTPMIAKSSRVAIANPGTTPANLDLMPFNANGTPALFFPLRIRVVAGGQSFTDDIVMRLGLSPTFVGSMTITSDVPVLVFNQARTGNTGAVVPVYPR